MPQIFFYIFAILAVLSACSMVIVKNPVSSALWMVASFVGLAALFVGLNAYFVGIIQILVYAGAIMVLFVFIIMLLDLKAEEKRIIKPTNIAAAVIVPGILLLQIFGVLLHSDLPEHQALDLPAAALAHERVSSAHYQEELAEDPEFKVPVGKIQANLAANQLPDVHLIGRTVFAGRADIAELKALNPEPAFNPEHSMLTSNNLPLQVMGVLLLVSTIGVVVLSKKSSPVRSNG